MQPFEILLLSRNITPSEHLSEEVIVSLGKIQVEGPRKSLPRKNRSSRTNKKQPVQKTTFKKKAESFDDAMRMKIVADLNKLTDKNYEVIMTEIQKLYSRISEELKGNILRLIIENSTKQHIYSKGYMRMFMDLTKGSPEERKMGSSLLLETMNSHEKTIFNDLSNGESYDDFCEANKVKISRIGMSIMLGESCNLGMIPAQVIGQHAINLLQIMDKIRTHAKDTNREAVENQTECVLQFFRTIAKTKITRDGFQKCIAGFIQILQKEKKEKKLNPKSRFALMDFVDDMKRMYTEEKKKEEKASKNVYVPKKFVPKKTISSE
jgi:hypothetical protein